MMSFAFVTTQTRDGSYWVYWALWALWALRVLVLYYPFKACQPGSFNVCFKLLRNVVAMVSIDEPNCSEVVQKQTSFGAVAALGAWATRVPFTVPVTVTDSFVPSFSFDFMSEKPNV